MGAGRKPKLTPEIQTTIVNALALGNFRHVAAALAGIDNATMRSGSRVAKTKPGASTPSSSLPARRPRPHGRCGAWRRSRQRRRASGRRRHGCSNTAARAGGAYKKEDKTDKLRAPLRACSCATTSGSRRRSGRGSAARGRGVTRRAASRLRLRTASCRVSIVCSSLVAASPRRNLSSPRFDHARHSGYASKIKE